MKTTTTTPGPLGPGEVLTPLRPRGEDPVGPQIDIASLIDGGVWGLGQKVVLGLAALAFAIEGMAGQVLGPSIPALIRTWHAPRASFAIVSALGLVGFILGATFGGSLGDRIGRRRVLIGTMVLIGLATMGCALAHDPVQLGLWRVVAGVGLGASIPLATVVITEFTPARHRSTAIAIGITFLPLGGMVTGAVASYVLPRYHWSVLYVCVGLIALAVGLLLQLALPESPRFLLRSPAQRQALLRLLARLGFDVDHQAQITDHADPVERAPLRALFRARLGRETAYLWSAFFFLVFAMYAVFSWMPEALVAEGLTLALAGQAVSSFAFGGVCGNLLGGWLTGRFGVRASLLLQVAVGVAPAAGLAMLHGAGAGFSQLTLALLFLLGASINGAQTALYIVAAMLYPPSIRSTGVGFAVAIGRVGALLSSFLGVYALNAGGSAGYFGIIGLAIAATIGFGLAVRIQGPDRSGRH